MTPISVVIITYNEEKNIERCLASVVDIADEIVVLDSFSTDKTEEICKQYGVSFFQHSFEGYIEQKNRAIGYAKFPHILSLDADEALDDTLKQSILNVKSHWVEDGYSFNRLTNYCGHWIRHCGWYPDKKLRLWDSMKGVWRGINPHDKYIMDLKCTTRHLKGDLLHYSYYTISEHVNQSDNFTNIAALAAYNKGRKSSLMKVWLYPKWKFFRDFIIKLGFLDGYYGYVVCKINANATFQKYVKLLQLQNDKV